MNETHFDAVIVGSGFGGSVMAYRLAEAGLRVCLLERGKEYPPGSFPRSPYRIKKNFWDPSEGLHGLYNFWSFRWLDVLVSSGLGGGSLIYANVLIRKDEKWFVKEDVLNGGYEYWPVTRAELDPHYDAVEKMLRPQKYPFDQAPYNETSKTKAFKEAAERLGLKPFLPNLAVTFANEGEVPVPGEPIREEHPNLHRRTRYTCRLTGECDFGCNYGSKNTLDYNYLSEAERHNAHLMTRCEVRAFEPRDGGGYAVHYVWHDPEREGRKTDTSLLPLQTITADRLILSAGTLGSTFLLLKNRSAFPRISRRLGTRFGGNGDLLTFAAKASEEAGGERVPRIIDPGYGPVITSAIRVGDELDGEEGRGFYLEDAGFPEHITWMLQVFDTPGTLWRWRVVAERLLRSWIGKDPESDLGAELSELLSKTDLSAGVLPLLGMGRDIPDGNMKLRGSKLDVDWRKRKSGPYFDRVRDTSRRIARELGASFRDNPIWYLNRVVTVHPLGGCPMGRDEREGVVDPYGEVFNYPGLYVADGSVMPGPVGPNPSLTIAALADRFAERLLEGNGKTAK
ncbi:MAG: GMC family oxidoreductase [Actinomycetota bacterium]|nr:GMC family oxidoreductase [Actinomycetota bacterium]